MERDSNPAPPEETWNEASTRSRRALARAVAALGLSATLHAGAILLLDVAPQGASRSRAVVIAARLAETPPAPAASPPPASVEPVPPPEPAAPEVPAPPRDAAGSEPPPATPGTDTARVAAGDDVRPKLDVPLVVDPTYYTARELDVPPRPMNEIVPVFPPAAQVAQLSGYVILEIRIDQGGSVESVEVSESKPPQHFDESARRAFIGQRFTPAVKNGQAVKALVRIRVDYLLGEETPR